MEREIIRVEPFDTNFEKWGAPVSVCTRAGNMVFGDPSASAAPRSGRQLPRRRRLARRARDYGLLRDRPAVRCRSAQGWWSPQQSGGESHQPFRHESGRCSVFEVRRRCRVQLSSRPGPQPFQSGAASRHSGGLQAEMHGRIGGVARPCWVDHRLREGMSRYASTNRRYFDNARQAFDEWARALGPLPARPALPFPI